MNLSDQTNKFNQQVKLQLLKLLAENSKLSQRDLSREMGVSLGKVNFCLTGLIDKGCIKLEGFKNARNRFRYAYILTPGGIEEKLKLTALFLKRKMEEYSEIKQQIQELSRDLEIEDPSALEELLQNI